MIRLFSPVIAVPGVPIVSPACGAIAPPGAVTLRPTTIGEGADTVIE